MGSTTREAIIGSRAALAAASGLVDLATAEGLLSAGRIIGSSAQLQAVLSDPSTDEQNKVAALRAVFGRNLSSQVVDILAVVVTNRWSSQDDLLAGIEELGLRAAAASAPAGTDIEGELFAFGRAVRSDAELELAIGSKLGDTGSKVDLVNRLLVGKVSSQTLAIVRHLVQQPRGRRINALLSDAASVIADQSGFAIATVSTAQPISPAQLTRLQAGLTTTYGRPVKINQVTDKSLIGGVRVQIGDEIIDGSVATKLNELRLQLAG